MSVPVWYINLAARRDRRRAIEAALDRAGLVATRLEAMAPTEIADADLRTADRDRGRRLPLTPPEIGCALSHRAAWAGLVECGAPLGCILEDDVRISPLLAAFLAGLPDLPTGPGLVRLESVPGLTALGPVVARGPGGIVLRPMRRLQLASGGYVISARYARELLALPRARLLAVPVDVTLFHPDWRPCGSDAPLQTVGGLVTQMPGPSETKGRGRLASDIAATRTGWITGRLGRARWRLRRALRGPRLIFRAPVLWLRDRSVVRRVRFRA